MDLKNMLELMEKKEPRVNLFLVHKVNGKNGRSFSVANPEIASEFEKNLLDIIKNALKVYQDMRVVPYNITGCNDSIVEMSKVFEYTAVDSLKNSLKNPRQKFRFDTCRFDFFVYKVYFDDSDEELFFFRKSKNFKTFQKGFVGKLFEGRFKKLADTNKLLATDETIDFVLNDEDIYIFQHLSFERVFDLNSEFSKQAKMVLDRVGDLSKIESFDKLRKSAMGNGNYVKRLAKLNDGDNANTATLFLEDLVQTQKVINEFNLDIEIDTKNNKMKFKDESQTSSYISLMQDAYYETLIGKVKGIDERR